MQLELHDRFLCEIGPSKDFIVSQETVVLMASARSKFLVNHKVGDGVGTLYSYNMCVVKFIAGV